MKIDNVAPLHELIIQRTAACERAGGTRVEAAKIWRNWGKQHFGTVPTLADHVKGVAEVLSAGVEHYTQTNLPAVGDRVRFRSWDELAVQFEVYDSPMGIRLRLEIPAFRAMWEYGLTAAVTVVKRESRYGAFVDIKHSPYSHSPEMFIPA